MDDEVDDEVAAIEAGTCRQIQRKESEYLLNPDNHEMLEFHGMVIPNEGFDRIGGSEHASASPRCLEDGGVMVEELIVKNYNDENLALIGTSNNRDKKNHWQHLHQIAGGSGIGGSHSHGDGAYRDSNKGIPSVREDVGYANFQEFLDKQTNVKANEVVGNLSSENKSDSSNSLLPPVGIRTKILSKSGFSEFFVKSTLKGKGVICRGPARETVAAELTGQIYPKVSSVNDAKPDASSKPSREIVVPPSHGIAEPCQGLRPKAFNGGVNLREWLKSGQNKANKAKSLYIFKQIVDLVDSSHSQGVSLREIQPSYFKLLPSNQVMYIGSYVKKEIVANVMDCNIHHTNNDRNGKRPLEQSTFPVVSKWAGKRKFGENTNTLRQWPQFLNRSANDTKVSINEFNEERASETDYMSSIKSNDLHLSNKSLLLSTSVSDPMEEKWYTSPEELNERCCTFSSNIYCLGTLLFEVRKWLL